MAVTFLPHGCGYASGVLRGSLRNRGKEVSNSPPATVLDLIASRVPGSCKMGGYYYNCLEYANQLMERHEIRDIWGGYGTGYCRTHSKVS